MADGPRALRERRQAYEARAEGDAAVRGCLYGLILGTAMWTAGLVAWWLLSR